MPHELYSIPIKKVHTTNADITDGGRGKMITCGLVERCLMTDVRGGN